MAIRNRAALLDLANALNEQENYNQHSWGSATALNEPVISVTECTTRACLAGHTVMRAHYQPRVTNSFGPSGNTLDLNWNWVRKSKKSKNFRHVSGVARKLLGLSKEEAKVLFDSYWKPRQGLSVQDALYELADGASVESITDPDLFETLSNKSLSASCLQEENAVYSDEAFGRPSRTEIKVEYV